MKFNNYIWSLYRESAAGSESIRSFSALTPDIAVPDLRVLEFPYTAPNGMESVHEVDLVDLVRQHAARRQIDSIQEATAYYLNLLVRQGIDIELPDHPEFPLMTTALVANESDWYDRVEAISLGLHLAHTRYFVPYRFRREFDKFERLCEQFGILLPAVPGKGSKAARVRYYAQINLSLYEFRTRHNLNPAELCAFLYDFSVRFFGTQDVGDLPLPSKVWLVTGGEWDFDSLDDATAASVTTWAGNSATRRGDIILMYCRKPRSCIHSIWRACSDGFVDPFSHYHGNVSLGFVVKTVPVTFAEMANHVLLSKKPEIKAHLQGAAGRQFSVREYEAILEIMHVKGQDLSGFPRIPLHEHLLEVELLEERDIEIHLIEPLLKRLGYAENDWVRQLPVKMGRGERNYPDYAVGAIAKRGEERAKLLVESKFRLSGRRDFEDAYYQAKSYALRLQSKTIVLASLEGIWIYHYRREDFDIKHFTAKSWAELADPDVFHEVMGAIGKQAVLGRSKAK